ncbi:MAG: substrate-binding domain-containing protein [Spirochaetia bacterium]|jgi:ribose transport system substrate-binding protein
MRRKSILVLAVAFVFMASMAMSAFGDTAIEMFLKGTLHKTPPYTVGLSNGLITHSWRTQMVNDVEKEFQLYKGMGVVNKLIVQHAGNEVELQISQIRNLINSNVDLLLINPNSQSALTPVIEEANAKGILVIVFDQRINSPDCLQVYTDIYNWSVEVDSYVFKKMGGKGSVYYLSGYDGSPANIDRDKAFYDTVKKYPAIKVLGKSNGNWDPATSQQVMSNVLAAVPKMDGLVTHDGEALGSIRAFDAAGRALPMMNGEAMLPYLEYWLKHKKEGFSSFAIENGPGYTITVALGMGIRILEGKQVKQGFFKPDAEMHVSSNTIWAVPLKNYITDDNVQKVYNDHMADRGILEYIDNWYSQEQLDALFK